MEKGIVLALAVGSLALNGFANVASAAQVDLKPGQIKCGGVNSCAGEGDCASKTNTCAGMNKTKEQGWKAMTADECTKKGGKVMTD